MLKLKFIGSKTEYDVEFRRISGHIVEVKGAIPEKSKGFTLHRIEEKDDVWDYQEFDTIYRRVEGGLQFSDDGSVWIPKVIFHAGEGGFLSGKTEQEAYDYSDLVVPEAVASENYVFAGWSPEIPEAGEIQGDLISFNAMFESTVTPEPPGPTELDILGERVDSMEAVMIENYENQVTINEDVETAIIELYEMTGGK